LSLARTLIVEEEDSLILLNRSTECAPELVLAVNGNGIRKILGGVQRSIPKKFKTAAMKSVGT
jgi:hypothetical protein